MVYVVFYTDFYRLTFCNISQTATTVIVIILVLLAI